MRQSKRPGRPMKPRSVDEFGAELTFAELGLCLGTSRYKAKVLVVDNGVPTISRGRVQTIHRAVAEQVINGSFWTAKV